MNSYIVLLVFHPILHYYLAYITILVIIEFNRDTYQKNVPI